ncbi:MAG TPA: L,D-transpeptidase family protein [Wenzhouxiangellaceae bacterium]|nr:L,D-transpeptidase family protein [Wenzhouxiangellaceae bacterium]
MKRHPGGAVRKPRASRICASSAVTARAASVLLVFAAACPLHAVEWPLVDDRQVVGELITDRLRGEDTLVDMARMHNIGHFEIRAANPQLDPWLPRPGAEVLIPQLHVLPDVEREGIVVNLAERRLYYFTETWPDRDGAVVSTHPVGVGLLDRATPVAQARVTAKVDNPAWYPNQNTRDWYRREKNEILPAVVPAGPENPLGQHALILDADGLLIHGTHRPSGVGMRVSQGCIRLYPESIASLIGQVPVGTRVRIIDQPARSGWRGEALYLEVDPAGDEPETRHDEGVWRDLRAHLENRAAGRAEVDWDKARAAFERADGVPVVVASTQ